MRPYHQYRPEVLDFMKFPHPCPDCGREYNEYLLDIFDVAPSPEQDRLDRLDAEAYDRQMDASEEQATEYGAWLMEVEGIARVEREMAEGAR